MADIASSGTANSFIRARHITKTSHAHQVKAASLFTLLQQAYNGDDAIKPLLDTEVLDISYPVLQYPEKVKSHNFDKTPEISGVLQGIKGQYLILDTGVLNIRKFSGYHITMVTE